MISRVKNKFLSNKKMQIIPIVKLDIEPKIKATQDWGGSLGIFKSIFNFKFNEQGYKFRK